MDNRQDIIGTGFTTQGESHCVYEGPDVTDRICQMPAANTDLLIMFADAVPVNQIQPGINNVFEGCKRSLIRYFKYRGEIVLQIVQIMKSLLADIQLGGTATL